MPTSTRRQAQARSLANSDGSPAIETPTARMANQGVADAHAVEHDMEDEALEADEDEEAQGILFHHSLQRSLTMNRRRTGAIPSTRTQGDLIVSVMDSQHCKAWKRRSSTSITRYITLLAIRRSATTPTNHPLLQTCLYSAHAYLPGLGSR